MEGLLTFAIIIGVAGAIAIIAFVIYRVTHPKLKSEVEQKTEQEYAQEELDRVLQPVDDEQTAQEINNYKENDD